MADNEQSPTEQFSNDILEEVFQELHNLVVDNSPPVIDSLFSARVISARNMNDLQQIKNPTDQCSNLLILLHKTQNPRAFVELRQAIKREPTYDWLVERIDERYKAMAATASAQPQASGKCSKLAQKPQDELDTGVTIEDALSLKRPVLIFNVAFQQYLFVSNDIHRGDNIVETQENRDDARNHFVLYGTVERFRIYNPSTTTYLFVSNDIFNGDNVVEAHEQQYAGEERNYFTAIAACGRLYRIYNASYNKLIFASYDKRGSPANNVVEAHALGRNDLREEWRLEWVPDGLSNGSLRRLESVCVPS